MLSVRASIATAVSAVAFLAFTTAATASVYSDAVTQPGGLGASLVSYWKFEDPNVSSGALIADATGTHIGTAHGPVASIPGVPGIGGSAVSFDGASEITAVATAAYPNAGEAFTFTGWLKTTQNSGSAYPTIFETGTEASQQNFSVILPSNTDGNFNSSVTGEIGVSQHGSGAGGTTAVNDGLWHYVAVTFDGTDYRLFVDGDTTPQVTKSMPTNIVPSTLRLGNGYGHFVGALDDVAIFGKALSAAEVNGLFTSAPEPTAGLLMFGLLAAGLRRSRR